jgi:hypothetical protein
MPGGHVAAFFGGYPQLKSAPSPFGVDDHAGVIT